MIKCPLYFSAVLKQVKYLFIVTFLLNSAKVFAQVKKHPAKKPVPVVAKPAFTGSPQLKNFLAAAAQANVTFTVPPGFKEIKAPNNEDYSFDYAMTRPGEEFEIWIQVKSQKENYAAYERSLNNKSTRQANPDSLYLAVGNAHAIALSNGADIKPRNLPQYIVERYNADAGKSYLISLPDEAATKHYKYALLVTLQKDHIGTILAVCFTNDKGPEFFKNMDEASNCVRFKP